MKTKSRFGFACLFAALALVIFSKFVLERGLLERERVRDAYSLKSEEQEKTQALAAVFREKMNHAFTIRDWEELLGAIPPFSSKEEADLFSSVTAAKLFEARALERDTLLFFAGKLAKINERDPTAREYILAAQELHDENLRVFAEIREQSDDCEWNRRLWYRKGIEQYRTLVFLKKEEQSRALDIVDQAIQEFEKVFSCVPKDRDAEVAIELLYKHAKDMLNKKSGGNDAPASIKEKLPLLPQGEIGPGEGGQQREQGRH